LHEAAGIFPGGAADGDRRDAGCSGENEIAAAVERGTNVKGATGFRRVDCGD